MTDLDSYKTDVNVTPRSLDFANVTGLSDASFTLGRFIDISGYCEHHNKPYNNINYSRKKLISPYVNVNIPLLTSLQFSKSRNTIGRERLICNDFTDTHLSSYINIHNFRNFSNYKLVSEKFPQLLNNHDPNNFLSEANKKILRHYYALDFRKNKTRAQIFSYEIRTQKQYSKNAILRSMPNILKC